jgi:hypothetical protein
VEYDLEVASACLVPPSIYESDSDIRRGSPTDSGYVAPSALRIRRRDGAPSQVIV